jgi:hypothetical protein
LIQDRPGLDLANRDRDRIGYINGKAEDLTGSMTIFGVKKDEFDIPIITRLVG